MQDLFVGGQFHDIYRPARGEGGNEDHHKESAGKKLLIKLDPDAVIMNKIVAALIFHDKWYKEKSPPQFDLFFSYGDKAAHDVLMTDANAWASNKDSIKETGKPHYQIPFDTLVNMLFIRQGHGMFNAAD